MKNIQVKQVPLIAFCLLFTKALVVGVSWQDVGLGFIVATLAFLYEYKSQNAEMDKVRKETQEQVKELADKLEAVSKITEENRSYLSSMRLNSPNRMRL